VHSKNHQSQNWIARVRDVKAFAVHFGHHAARQFDVDQGAHANSSFWPLAISATPCRSGSKIQAQYGEPANTKKAPSHVAAGPSHGKRTLLRAHNRQHRCSNPYSCDRRHRSPPHLAGQALARRLLFPVRPRCMSNLIVAKPSLDHFDYWLVLVDDHQPEEPHWFAADNFAAVPATAFHVLRFSRF
jgi:hypothetical protein